MTTLDTRGNPVSLCSSYAMERYETAVELLHGYFGDPLAVVESVLADEPEFVMGYCLRAALMVISTEKAAVETLRDSVEVAELLWYKANDRERRHIAAARAWLNGDFEGASRTYGEIVRIYPHDTLAIQVAHVCDFMLGNRTMLRDRIARALTHWDEEMPGYGYILGMYAFGLEENGEYERAESIGRRAVAMNPRDPWAIHAVAHVMEMQGRTAEGIAWLTDRVDDWAEDNAFAYHNWWHLALFHLELGEVDRVLELYDTCIRPIHSTVALEMVDASALLWRLELRGENVGCRWRELADAWEPMVEDAYYTFNDAHAMMALAATNRRGAMRQLIAAMERCAGGAGSNAVMTREVGLPVARAIRSFAHGDYAAAVELLQPVVPIAVRFGGSNAQRDVLSLTLLEAALRGRQGRLAKALVKERFEIKPTSPFNWAAIARAFELLGDRAAASRARAQAV